MVTLQTCVPNFPLMSMGARGRAEVLACADPIARTPSAWAEIFPNFLLLHNKLQQFRAKICCTSNVCTNTSEVLRTNHFRHMIHYLTRNLPQETLAIARNLLCLDFFSTAYFCIFFDTVWQIISFTGGCSIYWWWLLLFSTITALWMNIISYLMLYCYFVPKMSSIVETLLVSIWWK